MLESVLRNEFLKASENILRGVLPGIDGIGKFGSDGAGFGMAMGLSVKRAEARFASTVRYRGRGGLLSSKEFKVSNTASTRDGGAAASGGLDWQPIL
jgi:hypothetical protein